MLNFRRNVLQSLFAIALTASVFAAPGLAQAQSKVQLKTSMGDIVIELNDAKAPKSAANFLQYVDDGRIAFTPAVELSYLNEQEQYDLLEQMELNDCTPSLSQACRFKKMSGEEGLTLEVIATVMSEEKANQREMFKVPMERIRKYVPNANTKQAEDFVMKACEHYRRYLIRQRDRER